MGFRTLLVQERSSEVWNILSAVKSEFATFGNQLTKVQTQLKTASSSLDNLQGTRTRAMERKLRDVELIESEQSNEMLELQSEEKNDQNS
jgi:DNA recombination protein RmuC